MNWKEIKEKYPKGWDKLLQWRNYLEINEDANWKQTDYYGELGHFFNDGIHTFMREFAKFNIRDLYDFFDGQRIYIGIDYHYAIGIERWFSIYFTWGKMDYLKIDHFNGTRKEVEEQAFLKAFEILEEQEIRRGKEYLNKS